MAGIVSFGAYVPPTRLPLALLAGRAPKDGGPEKAVAWNDEDAVTLAVAAGANALRGFDRADVDALLFASTTAPFAEKQAAALVAHALDLRRDVQTADLAGSLRAGTTALRQAVDMVRAGSARCVLVVASDCRLGAPGSAQERAFGDGAAALLVGEADAVATLEGAFSVADEIVDTWRTPGDPFVHSWEERFVVQEGYTPTTIEAVRGLLAKLGAGAGDFTRAALQGPTRAATPAWPGPSGSTPHAWRTRSSAGSDAPAPPSRRCCWWPRSRARARATASSPRATATGPRRWPSR